MAKYLRKNTSYNLMHPHSSPTWLLSSKHSASPELMETSPGETTELGAAQNLCSTDNMLGDLKPALSSLHHSSFHHKRRALESWSPLLLSTLTFGGSTKMLHDIRKVPFKHLVTLEGLCIYIVFHLLNSQINLTQSEPQEDTAPNC